MKDMNLEKIAARVERLNKGDLVISRVRMSEGTHRELSGIAASAVQFPPPAELPWLLSIAGSPIVRDDTIPMGEVLIEGIVLKGED